MPQQAEAASTQTPIEAGSPATVSTAATTGQEATIDISKYIAPDGKFKEGYKELLPEDLRGNKFFDIFPDIQGVMKAAGHEAIELGKYRSGKGVLPINEKSNPYEIDAFRTAMGVPKDAAGYKYTPPEDISFEDLSPEFMTLTMDGFNKAHYTQSQVDTAMNLYANHLREIEKAVDTQLAKQVSDAENRIRGEWGDKFDARTNLAKAFITKMASGWSPQKYEELFGKEVQIQNADGMITTTREGGINDAEFAPIRVLLLDLFANIEEKYGIEDSALAPEAVGTPSLSLQQQLEEIEKTPGLMDGKLRTSLDSRDRAKHEELMKQRDAIYKRLYPT